MSKSDFSSQILTTPNYDPEPISVEFLVIHYTGGRLERTLSLFGNPSQEKSAHIVIPEDGEILELVSCSKGTAYRAWHAGESKWFDGEKEWQAFNNFSIGVELVNKNGNVFPYTDQQYKALGTVVLHLKTLFPALRSPKRVLGHEHISSWRGKADPGCMFEWDRFFRLCYEDQEAPTRSCVCPTDLASSLQKLAKLAPLQLDMADQFWHAVNDVTETSIRLFKTVELMK